jgi:hypothetical protein
MIKCDTIDGSCGAQIHVAFSLSLLLFVCVFIGFQQGFESRMLHNQTTNSFDQYHLIWCCDAESKDLNIDESTK